MDNDELVMIPLVVHENSENRQDKRNSRLVKVIVFLISCLVVCNMTWLYVFQSYEYDGTETITVGGDEGNANYVGRDGDISNGMDKSGETAQKD